MQPLDVGGNHLPSRVEPGPLADAIAGVYIGRAEVSPSGFYRPRPPPSRSGHTSRPRCRTGPGHPLGAPAGARDEEAQALVTGNGARAPLIQWETSAAKYPALLELACGIIVFQQAGLRFRIRSWVTRGAVSDHIGIGPSNRVLVALACAVSGPVGSRRASSHP